MSAILKELSLFSDQAEDSPGIRIGPDSRQVASAMWESGLKHTYALLVPLILSVGIFGIVPGVNRKV